MRGDFTRNTFRPEKHYSGVRWQQGRVGPLDAEWNEQLDITLYRSRTTQRDVIGACGGPKGVDDAGDALAGFGLSALGGDLTIGKGRFYVQGILCENETDVLLTNQKDLPGYALPSAPGRYLAYLDVWERHITALEDDEIREPALGIPDTTTRTRVTWQVRLERVGEPGAEIDCADFGPGWMPADMASTGLLAARAEPSPATEGPCLAPPQAGYRRLENQLYRVEIRQSGTVGEATFIYSRENGSIVTRWEGQDGIDSNNLIVQSTGRDRVLGLAAGDWVELTDDVRDLYGRPGVLVRLSKVDGRVLTIDPATIQHPDDPGATSVDRGEFTQNPKVRRWESAGAQPVTIPTENDGWIELEDGVQIKFQAGGDYRTGDYWMIPARTPLGDVLWPRAENTNEPLFQQRHGTVHHYCPLALVTWRLDEDETLTLDEEIIDCRPLFPSLTDICAEDVCFDNNNCNLPGAATVQDALDQICARNDLPHHNKHLHGWGIVCGLAVHCGPHENGRRRHITVHSGYALDCDGNDVILEQAQRLDILTMIERHAERGNARLLDENGNGDVCLILNSDGRDPFMLERHDPNRGKNPWQMLLTGTLLMDFYDHCIKRIVDFVREEFTLPTDDSRAAGPVEERVAAFTNLVAQPINPKVGQHIFLSRREHVIMHDFYVRLRALLQSNTYCAMFDNARPFPDYPDEFLAAGMDTVFGKSFHARLRLRPRTTEGYTVGSGLNPLRPSTQINRYELAGADRRMLSQIDPLAGSEAGQQRNDSGVAAVQDVAFSPDGRLIYVIVATRDEEDTFFRVGQFQRDRIVWQPLVTICGVKLVTLATTPADPKNVYAVGLKKVIIRSENGQERVEYRGMGIYRINPNDVRSEMDPLAPFNACGHLRISEDGRAFATAAAEGASPTRYDRIFAVRVPQGAPLPQGPLLLNAQGSDDIAIHTGGNLREERLYTVVGPTQNVKRVLIHRIADGRPIEANLPVANTAIRLEVFRPTNVLAITAADGYNLQVVDLDANQLDPDYLLPMQVSPLAVAASVETKSLYVLNSASNTITTIENPEVLRPRFRFDLARLAQYRAGVLNAFVDLLAGFLQYLKDCLCDHFLVNCPECTGEEKLYLACVSIRNGEVERVCNFSQRRYVKSFPTVGYWLSLIPIVPMIDHLVEQFCCLALPNLFGRVAARPSDDRYTAEYRPTVSAVSLFQGADFLRGVNLMDQLGQLFNRSRQATGLAAERLRTTSLTPGTEAPAVSRPLVGEPVDRVANNLAARNVTVHHEVYSPEKVGRLTTIFRTPPAGSEVTLYEENGVVRYYEIREPAAAPTEVTEGLRVRVQELSEAVRSRDTELQTLRTQVTALTQEQNALKTGPAEVAALRTELEELRRFREEVTRFMRQSPR